MELFPVMGRFRHEDEIKLQCEMIPKDCTVYAKILLSISCNEFAKNRFAFLPD
jgi:hypothetical protein